MSALGHIQPPSDFRYREVFLRGKPTHEPFDAFSIKHPAMSLWRRAKIFSPFDALSGFDEALAGKEVPYEPRRELPPEDTAILNRRLVLLERLTQNGRDVREHPVTVTATYFVPCPDKNSFAYGLLGRYERITGTCKGVDFDVGKTLTVGERKVPLADLFDLTLARQTDDGNTHQTDGNTDITDTDWS